MFRYFRNLYLLLRFLGQCKVKREANSYSIQIRSGIVIQIEEEGTIRIITPGDFRANAGCFYFNCEENFVYEQKDAAQTQSNKECGCRKRSLQSVS